MTARALALLALLGALSLPGGVATHTCASALTLNNLADFSLDTIGHGETHFWRTGGPSRLAVLAWNTVAVDVQAFAPGGCQEPAGDCSVAGGPVGQFSAEVWTCSLAADQTVGVTGAGYVWSQVLLVNTLAS